MFKVNWEKTEQHYKIAHEVIVKIAKLAYPEKNLSSYIIMSGGCANLNIKLQFDKDDVPLILRIYFRDKSASFREQNLGKLLHHQIPIPQTYYIGDYEYLHFAITEFMPGITLRDLLLGEKSFDLHNIMYQAGRLLCKISAHKNIGEQLHNISYLDFAEDCLYNEQVIAVMGLAQISKISNYLNKHVELLPDGSSEINLVHGDFDPANILVDNVDGDWKISAILDWEFAFAGPHLTDLANMLRYAKQMSQKFYNDFQSGFLDGLKDGGFSLSSNWQLSIDLLNLVSLLDCLKRSDPKNSRMKYADITELINQICSAD